MPNKLIICVLDQISAANHAGSSSDCSLLPIRCLGQLCINHDLLNGALYKIELCWLAHNTETDDTLVIPKIVAISSPQLGTLSEDSKRHGLLPCYREKQNEYGWVIETQTIQACFSTD